MDGGSQKPRQLGMNVCHVVIVCTLVTVKKNPTNTSYATSECLECTVLFSRHLPLCRVQLAVLRELSACSGKTRLMALGRKETTAAAQVRLVHRNRSMCPPHTLRRRPSRACCDIVNSSIALSLHAKSREDVQRAADKVIMQI